MHFIKTAISLLTLAGFAMANHHQPGLEAREEYRQYLAKRNEYESLMERHLGIRASSYKCMYSTTASAWKCALDGITPKCTGGCSESKSGKKCSC